MCFCASASFAAAGLLSLIGLRASYKASSSQQMVACIPLLFAAQQFAEGVIWVTPELSVAHKIATYTFLLCAFVIWPVWIPLSLLQCERDEWRRKILLIVLMIGSFLSVFLAKTLALYGATASALGKHIRYDLPVPYDDAALFGILAVYLICTVIPFLITSIRILRILGILLAISCYISFAFERTFFISIWCFCAAVLSLGILVALREMNQAKP